MTVLRVPAQPNMTEWVQSKKSHKLFLVRPWWILEKRYWLIVSNKNRSWALRSRGRKTPLYYTARPFSPCACALNSLVLKTWRNSGHFASFTRKILNSFSPITREIDSAQLRHMHTFPALFWIAIDGPGSCRKAPKVFARVSIYRCRLWRPLAGSTRVWAWS